MDDAELQPLVAEEYRRLAEVLESLSADSWERPSLCAGWRLREVIAHVTMPARYTDAAFMEQLQAYEFDFTRLSDAIAARDAELPAADLVAGVRSEALAAWAPPGGGYRGAINHAVIHGLDVATPLGVHGHVAPDTLRFILDDLTEGGTHQHFGINLDERRLEATDIDWSFGQGRPLTAPAEVLASLVCGRTVDTGQVRGEPLSRA